MTLIEILEEMAKQAENLWFKTSMAKHKAYLFYMKCVEHHPEMEKDAYEVYQATHLAESEGVRQWQSACADVEAVQELRRM